MPGEVTLLDQSYRVPVTVQGLANRIIRRVSKRRAKIWNPRQAEGNISIIDNISQLQHNKFNDHSVMMLARTVKLLRRKFVPYCRFNGLLYKYFETPSIKPGFATAIHSWNELQAGKSAPADQLMKMYDLLPSEGHDNVPGIAWGYKSKLNRIADQMNPPAFSLQELRDNYGLLAQGDWDNVFLKIPPEDRTYIKKVLDKGHNITDKPKIHISTIHRVKGGQADKVVLLSDTGKVDQADMSRDEETRIFYTGITRTFEDLIIVQPESKSHYEDLFI
jgi:hypothetical protein